MFGLPVLQLYSHLLPRGQVNSKINLTEGAAAQLSTKTKPSCYPDIHITYHIIFVVEKFLSEAVLVLSVLLVMFVFPPGSSCHCSALAPVKGRRIIVGRQVLVRLTVRQQTLVQ